MEKRIYCLVPLELAGKLHDALRRHFRDEPTVEVVVEHRMADRRSGDDRRTCDPAVPPGPERRLIRSATGRRMGDRRASLVRVAEPPELPRRVRRFASELSFVERVEPSSQEREDLDTARLVARFQAGEKATFSELYTRYFDRVYGYLRAALRDPHEAEDATQNVFLKLLEALPSYEHREQPFRHWLFTLVRNHALDQIEKRRRVEVVPDEELERHDQRSTAEAATQRDVFNWLSDRELQLFVERLPQIQRQVLALRYMLGFSVSEVATILEIKPNTVSAIQHRALRRLENRLRAIGRRPERHGPREGLRSRRWVRQASVLRSRRFALTRF